MKLLRGKCLLESPLARQNGVFETIRNRDRTGNEQGIQFPVTRFAVKYAIRALSKEVTSEWPVIQERSGHRHAQDYDKTLRWCFRLADNAHAKRSVSTFWQLCESNPGP